MFFLGHYILQQRDKCGKLRMTKKETCCKKHIAELKPLMCMIFKTDALLDEQEMLAYS
jgi:hypothetical protein